MDVQLCSLHNFQLWDPFEGCKQKPIASTLVIINPKLKVHDCILGKNTMNDLRVMANMRSDTIHTYTGKRIRMLSTQAEKDWSEYSDDVYDEEEGELPPWKRPGKPKWMKRMHSRTKDAPKSKSTATEAAATKYHRVEKRSKPKSKPRAPAPKPLPAPTSSNAWSSERVKVKREVARRWDSTLHKYTQDDQQQLRMAKRRMAKLERDDEALRARVAQVTLSHHTKAPDSPMLYQPYKRLIRVADLVNESTDGSGYSVLGAHANDSTITATPPAASSRYEDSPPWAAAYPLPMQYTKHGTPISVQMSAVTPIARSAGSDYWTPTGATTAPRIPSEAPTVRNLAASTTSVSKDVTLTSAELYLRTQQHFSSPAPMRAANRFPAKVQSKLSFTRVKQSPPKKSSASTDEFPVEDDFVAEVEASMDAHTRSLFDPASPEIPTPPMPYVFDPTKQQFPIPSSRISDEPLSAVPAHKPDSETVPSVDIMQASLNVDYHPDARPRKPLVQPAHSTKPAKDSLQHALTQAASFGAYMPILVNGIATV